MYSVVLYGRAYAKDEGEYKTIETKHHFEVAGVTSLMELIGSMAESSSEELRLTIEWREENDD